MTENMRLCQAPLTPEKSQSPFLRQTALLQKNRQSGKNREEAKMGEIIQLKNAKSVQPEHSVKENKPRRVSQKPVILTLSVLVVVLTASCCLLGYHLQRVQKSRSAANRTILEASSYLRTADERLDRYVDYIEEYIPRKYVSFVDRFSYSRTFESCQRSHPIPDPDPYPWNK